MDKITAARMETELQGKIIAGWSLGPCIGHGKSALVFQATRDEEKAAVKIFDREMVERFGKLAQRERISRERQLVGEHHPHLIQVFDAGEDHSLDLFYVIMEFFPGKNLAALIDRIPSERIQPLISQIASAAEFLENRKLAHRDIKPENIGITDDYSSATLLDLGVIRPIGLGNITDDKDQKNFVGTLQYSPPELLLRKEDDSTDGWRGITFYQLGAVLHDMIARRPLFADFLTPYAKLVEAVQHEIPIITAPNSHPNLTLLAQNCLIKEPNARLSLVTWESFHKSLPDKNSIEAARERILQRSRAASTPQSPNNTLISSKKRVHLLRQSLEQEIRSFCTSNSELFSPVTVESHEAGDHVCICLQFATSQERALSQQLSVYIDGTILDNAADTVRISIGGVLSKNGTSKCSLHHHQKLTKIFEGVRNDDLMHSFLRDSILIIFDKAQQACAAGLISVSDSLWLTTETTD